MAKYEPPLMRKKIYVRSKENILASYNYTDVVEGSGAVDFYLGTTNSSAGIKYIMDSNVFKTYATVSGDSTQHSCNVGGDRLAGTWNLLDMDFDTKIYNKQVTLFGTAVFTFRMSYFDDHSRITPSTAYPIIKVRKWDGTTETEIASVNGETVTLPTAGVKYRDYCLSVAVPKTIIKVGEQIRITVSINLIVNDSDITDYASCGIAYFPNNEETIFNAGWRDHIFASSYSQFIAKIPYLVQS